MHVRGDIESDFRVVILEQVLQDRDHSVQTVLFTNDDSHLAKSESDTGLKGDLGVNDGRLESGQNDVANLFSAQVLETLAKGGDSGILDLRLVIVEEKVEGLDEVVVCDFKSESLSKLGEVTSETKAHFPGLVLSGVEKRTKSVNAVLFLGQVSSHRDEGLDAKDSARVLIVLGELAEDGEEFLDNVLLVQLGGENAQFGSADTTNHWRVLLAKLHKLLS